MLEVFLPVLVLHFDEINEAAKLDSCRCLCNVMYLARNKRELVSYICSPPRLLLC